jgi:hypothetical protein
VQCVAGLTKIAKIAYLMLISSIVKVDVRSEKSGVSSSSILMLIGQKYGSSGSMSILPRYFLCLFRFMTGGSISSTYPSLTLPFFIYIPKYIVFKVLMG